MTEEKNYEFCQEIRAILAQLTQESFRQRNYVSELAMQAVRLENEIFVAEGELSTIVIAIEQVAGNAVSAVGNFFIGKRAAAAGDGIAAAVSLANAAADQRTKILQSDATIPTYSI